MLFVWYIVFFSQALPDLWRQKHIKISGVISDVFGMAGLQILNGFVVNGKRKFEKREGWSMAIYIGRYIKHPPIAESRIIAYDGKQVTFWYKDTETKQNSMKQR